MRCSQSDCSRTDVIGRGLCSMHYQRFKHQGVLDEVVPPKATTCGVCGKGLPLGHDPRQLFCSRSCVEAARQARRRALVTPRNSECAQCGGPLAGRRMDARFCSVKCGQDHRNARVKDDRRENRPPCDYCGQPIPLGQQRFCSEVCKRSARRPEMYGLTGDELQALLDQHAVCAICGSDNWRGKGPQVDHDHATGKVRGVLCVNCNNGLGRFADDPVRLRSAAAYLERAM